MNRPTAGWPIYDANGKSLRGLFLKSPLNYRRISSGYSNRRFHPILKKYLPHHGIDYAAAYGTRVWATAPGTVVYKGWKGALGNYVEIRHPNGYKTGYGHLSKFPRGLKKGMYVRQKQTIGFCRIDRSFHGAAPSLQTSMSETARVIASATLPAWSIDPGPGRCPRNRWPASCVSATVCWRCSTTRRRRS